MVYLLSSLLNSIQMLLYMFFMNAFFVRRHNSRLFWGYWLLWALIATVATNVFPSSIQLNGPFVFLMEIVILYGMNVTLYYGRWDRRLFTVVTSYAAIYSISSLMETLLLRITHMTRAEYLNNAPLYILFCLRRFTKGYYIKQPNMDCQPTEFTALSRHRAVFSWAGKGGIPICGA